MEARIVEIARLLAAMTRRPSGQGSRALEELANLEPDRDRAPVCSERGARLRRNEIGEWLAEAEETAEVDPSRDAGDLLA